MKLIEKCISIIDKIARIPDKNAEEFTRKAIEVFGLDANGTTLESHLKVAQIPKSNQHIFPESYMDYMSNVITHLSKSNTDGLPNWEMHLVNTYKSEFYRHAAFNFVSQNKTIIRLTDECAEYVDDIKLSAVKINEIDFPVKSFTMMFRMNGREFIVLVRRDEYGLRVTGLNTAIDTETEPAFASHTLLFDDHSISIDSLVREDTRLWKNHCDITKFNYSDLDQGLGIVQNRLRAFVLKFLFLYNHKFIDRKRGVETIKKLTLENRTRDTSKNTFATIHVSLGINEQKNMNTHRSVKSAIKAVAEHKWFTPWWPVGEYIRVTNGRAIRVKSHFRHRKAGAIRDDIMMVVSL